jgi:hypothetical protein
LNVCIHNFCQKIGLGPGYVLAHFSTSGRLRTLHRLELGSGHRGCQPSLVPSPILVLTCEAHLNELASVSIEGVVRWWSGVQGAPTWWDSVVSAGKAVRLVRWYAVGATLTIASGIVSSNGVVSAFRSGLVEIPHLSAAEGGDSDDTGAVALQSGVLAFGLISNSGCPTVALMTVSGQLKWARSLSTACVPGGSFVDGLVVTGGDIVSGINSPTRTALFALGLSGRVLWTRTVNDASPYAIGTANLLTGAPHGDVLLVGVGEGTLFEPIVLPAGKRFFGLFVITLNSRNGKIVAFARSRTSVNLYRQPEVAFPMVVVTSPHLQVLEEFLDLSWNVQLDRRPPIGIFVS